MTFEEKIKRQGAINSAFTPSAPVNRRDLFAGRARQIERVLGAVFQRGQHAILYGERGVGKTSLSNIIYDVLVLAGMENFRLARYNCGLTTTFETLWRSVFKQITVERDSGTLTLDQLLPDNPGSEDIREILQQADSSNVIVIDEVDTIAATDTVPILADTIKTLSDHSIATTLVLVGVADSVEQLIAEHQSIERALVQVQMPRMSHSELMEIIDNGLDSSKADMQVEERVKANIAELSQGLPHYTHLLTRHAALNAVNSDRTAIGSADFDAAVKEAVTNQQQTIRGAYHKATHSPRENLYKEVLLACALATIDELGYFHAGAIREPMQRITGKRYEIPSFSKHLNDFCDTSRGPVLERKGEKRRFRFRFINPMMQPYALLKGLSERLVTENQVLGSTAQQPPSLLS